MEEEGKGKERRWGEREEGEREAVVASSEEGQKERALKLEETGDPLALVAGEGGE